MYVHNMSTLYQLPIGTSVYMYMYIHTCMYVYAYSGTSQALNTHHWLFLDQYFLKKKSETSSEEYSARVVCLDDSLIKRSEESNMENLFLNLTVVYFSAGTKYLSIWSYGVKKSLNLKFMQRFDSG